MPRPIPWNRAVQQPLPIPPRVPPVVPPHVPPPLPPIQQQMPQAPPQGAPQYIPPVAPLYGMASRRPVRVNGCLVAVVLTPLIIYIIYTLAINNYNKGVQEDLARMTATAEASATPGVSAPPSGSTPSGNPIDPTATSIVTNIQMASAVDEYTLQPTILATSFKKSTRFYTTFEVISGGNISEQNPGYVVAKYYSGNALISTDPILTFMHNNINLRAWYYAYYANATPNGAVELYWCRQSDCSDEKLAQTASFTVS